MEPPEFLKNFLDAKWAWDVIQGPVYNRVIWNAAGDTIREMLVRVPPSPGARAFDVGSGPGFATRLFAELYPSTTVVGVDFSPVQVEFARRRLARNPVPNCSFQVGDAMSLEFPDNSFDFVFSIASIKHWPDPVRGLSEIFRVLKPGCSAHLGEADREYDPAELDKFIRAFTAPWWISRAVIGWYLRTIVFGQSLSRAEAERHALDAGFADSLVEKVEGRPFFRMELKKQGR